ncbi:MAG: lipopolysaccharide biosynthesis protein [Chitinophaga sp.]|uniref:lipopolysaccharide biosynthesis protein n=1 Tax=Chitinophaga sp. TaxID=1869181 RepID=UPI001B1F3787|nr:lipopolysaccharide biosynthesis protein [Chitinophaga sp.]MBO9732362.1 lipopolysaccharide biosynthesis protein [Chitinophaga sp.]
MGVIKQQSIKSTLLIYIGFAVGAINVVILFPHVFGKNEFGLTRLLPEIAMVLVPICTLSAVPTISRFFPYYASHVKNKDNDMLTWSVLATLIGFSLFVLGSIFFRESIINAYKDKSPLFVTYFYLLYPNVFLFALFGVFESYSASRHLSVFPNFLKELVMRLLTTVLIGAYYFRWISLDVFLWLFSLLYGALLLVLMIYLYRHHYLHFTFKVSNVTRRLSRQMLTYSVSLLGATLFTLLAKNLAPLILASKNGLGDVAYLTIVTYVSMLILIPQRSISTIGLPVLAQAWKERDMKKIDEVYTKSSLLQLIYAMFIFLVIWLNIDNFFMLLPEGYSSGKYVVLYFGIARVIDMGTGLNSQVLATSRFWRYDLYSSIVLLAFSFPLNFYLINDFGLDGSGYAELISIFIFNLIRYLFIWIKFGLQPFNWDTVKALAISLVAYLACMWIPFIIHPFIDIAIRSALFVVIFASLILVFKVSGDINSTVYTTWNKLRGRREE